MLSDKLRQLSTFDDTTENKKADMINKLSYDFALAAYEMTDNSFVSLTGHDLNFKNIATLTKEIRGLLANSDKKPHQTKDEHFKE